MAHYKTIGMEGEPPPALLPWLQAAAVGISVMDTTVRPHADPLYVVEVNNGLGGHEGAGSYVAWCNDPETADMVAAGLVALLMLHRGR